MATIRTRLVLEDEVSNVAQRVNNSLGNMTLKLLSVSSAIQIANFAFTALNRISEKSNQFVDTYKTQFTNELRLETVMKQRMEVTEQMMKDTLSNNKEFVQQFMSDVNNSINNSNKVTSIIDNNALSSEIKSVNEQLNNIDTINKNIPITVDLSNINNIDKTIPITVDLSIYNSSELEAIKQKTIEDSINSIKQLAGVQQNLGVYGDEMILAGAQEIATFTNSKKAIETLIPAMNDLIAQQYGYDASIQSFQSTADMMGKVLAGQTSALSRLGYIFTDEEESLLKMGTDEEKAATLAKIITENVGHMNQALAQTPFGQIQQLNNILGDVQEEVGKTLLPFKQWATILGTQWKIKFYEQLITALQFLQTHMKDIIVICGQVVASIGLVSAAMLVLKSKALITGMSMAISWAIANAPITIVIASILAIVAVLTVLALHSQTTFTAIGGFIGGVGGIFVETGAIIKHAFQTIIEGIVDGFLTMKRNVTNAFLTMFTFLLSGVEKVASAMDVVFGTSMAKGIGDFKSQLEAMKGQSEKFTLGWEDNRQGYANAWKTGKEAGTIVGQDLSDKLQSGLDKLTAGLSGQTDISQEILSKLQSGIDTNVNNEVKISDEYIRLLADKAVAAYQVKYSTVTPNVNVTVNGKANAKETADAVIKQLADNMQEISAVSLAGGF